MKLNDLRKVNELVDKKEEIDYKNNEIKFLEQQSEEDIVVQVGGEEGSIFVDKEYVVAMLEKIKKDNDAIIEKIKQELKELGVEVDESEVTK